MYIEITDDNYLLIKETKQGRIIAKHLIASGKGELIQDTNHKRDRTKGIDTYIETVAAKFNDKYKAKIFLEKVRKERPRYIRDQLQMISKQINQNDKNIIDAALDECINRELFSATEFIDMVQYLNRQRQVTVTHDLEKKNQIKAIFPRNESILQTDTYKRDINEYVSVLEGELS